MVDDIKNKRHTTPDGEPVWVLVCVLSVRTRAGCSASTWLNHKGACNQGKKVQDFYYCGVTRGHSLGF